jgi:AraC-like DNA-binding protein
MNPQHDLVLSPAAARSRKAIPGCVAREPEDEAFLPMAMTADDILAQPAFGACVRVQAQALLLLHQASPRTASPFATQQRWLMAQAALAKYFRNEAAEPGTGVLAERFLDLVTSHDLASRNTAAAFLQEMFKYGIVRHVAESEGRRYRPFEPSPMTLAALLHWLAVHLATLDGLDGGARSTVLSGQPALLGAIQPLIADGLLASSAVRKPDKTFSLFTWINDGGIVMDRLIAGCHDNAAGISRIPTDVMSISALSQRLNLSRSQLSRKFNAAEAMGSLGWSGTRGKSALWVSNGFWREYHVAQAVKLSIIDAAFATCVAQGAPVQAISDATIA